MNLASDAVAHEGAIPLKDAKNGDHVSPPPRWPEVPECTRELAARSERPRQR